MRDDTQEVPSFLMGPEWKDSVHGPFECGNGSLMQSLLPRAKEKRGGRYQIDVPRIEIDLCSDVRMFHRAWLH